MKPKSPPTSADGAAAAAIRNPALLALIAETGLRLAEIANLGSSSTLFVRPTTTVAADLVLKRLASRWRRWPAVGADPTPEAPGEAGEPPLRQAKRSRRTTKRGKTAPSLPPQSTRSKPPAEDDFNSSEAARTPAALSTVRRDGRP
jgi:hypothetical protein